MEAHQVGFVNSERVLLNGARKQAVGASNRLLTRAALVSNMSSPPFKFVAMARRMSIVVRMPLIRVPSATTTR